MFNNIFYEKDNLFFKIIFNNDRYYRLEVVTHLIEMNEGKQLIDFDADHPVLIKLATFQSQFGDD